MLLKDHPNIRPSLEHLVSYDPNFKNCDIEAIPHTTRICSYEAFARTLVGQQLSLKAASTIWGRVEHLAHPFTPQNILKLSNETLRAAGLSGQKIIYLQTLSNAVMDGSFKPETLHTLTDDDVIKTITALKGFGRWSAEMVLMFTLARPDVFSGGDLGLREGLKKVLKLDVRPTEKEAIKLAARWAPHRTAASLLLWQANKVE
jgi:DNA-3-methyladenine glycosylase II